MATLASRVELDNRRCGVIENVTRGWKISGLIQYLMGPGRFDEHVDQRVIASWDGNPELHQPPHRAESGVGLGEFDTSELVADLVAPAFAAGVSMVEPPPNAAGKVPQGPVWHCSLRNHLDDRVLSDAEWARVVADVLHATGIARHGDADGCRWVAVRHAPDHVHIAAVLVTQQTHRRVRPYREWPKVRAAVQAAEIRLGITRTAAADRTAVGQPSRAEIAKAELRGLDEPPRMTLRRLARVAAVKAQDPWGFNDALANLGVMVRWRRSQAGKVLGYAVALPGDFTAAGEPVWFSGSTLAPDLSLPKLRARWASTTRKSVIPPAPGERSTVGRAEARTAVAEAVDAIEKATASLAGNNRRKPYEEPSPATSAGGFGQPEPNSDHEDTEVAGWSGDAEGILHAAEDMLTAVSEVTAPLTEGPTPLGGPADVYQRVARVPGRGQPDRWGRDAAELRSAAWRLLSIGKLAGQAGGAASGGALMLALASLVEEIAAYHAARRNLIQETAARKTHELLTQRRPAGHPRGSGGPPGRGARERGPDQARTSRRDSQPRRAGGSTPSPVVPSVTRKPRGPGQAR